MNTEFNRVKLSLLREARRTIKSNLLARRFICVCLGDAAYSKKHPLAESARGQLCQLITQRLVEHPTLEGWLQSQGFHNARALYNLERVQRARIAWINSLIKEHGGRP